MGGERENAEESLAVSRAKAVHNDATYSKKLRKAVRFSRSRRDKSR
jgi:hypothetical protein